MKIVSGEYQASETLSTQRSSSCVSQIVAGTNYRLELQLAQGTNMVTHVVQVWDQFGALSLTSDEVVRIVLAERFIHVISGEQQQGPGCAVQADERRGSPVRAAARSAAAAANSRRTEADARWLGRNQHRRRCQRSDCNALLRALLS